MYSLSSPVNKYIYRISRETGVIEKNTTFDNTTAYRGVKASD